MKDRPGILVRLRNLLGVFLVVATVGFFARITLAGLSGATEFTVEEVRVEGTRYLDPAVLLAAADVQDLPSARVTQEDLERIGGRVAEHPLVSRVAVRRSLPAAVVIEITERVPVAFLPGDPVRGVDAEATELAGIDPVRYGSLPFVTGLPSADGAARSEALGRAIAALSALDSVSPRLLDLVSEVRPVPDGEITLILIPDGVRIRLDEHRLLEALPMVGALVEEGRTRHGPLAEVDLRFSGTVVYRERGR